MATLHKANINTRTKFQAFKELFSEPPKSSWYYQLKSSIHYDELTLQKVIKYKVQEILPNYSIIYFDKAITSSISKFDVCKPDFLLWKNDYSEWYIIEVELENHSFSHIKKQINTFYNGDYSDVKGISAYVKRKDKTCNETAFQEMITSKKPLIMLMADEIKCEWMNEFSSFGCLFSTIQAYCDENENFIYRISGDFPQEYSRFSFCTLDKHLRALNISSKDFLSSYSNKDIVKIFYRGQGDYWEYNVDGDSSMLFYNGDQIPIDITQYRWKIILNNKNQLHLIK